MHQHRPRSFFLCAVPPTLSLVVVRRPSLALAPTQSDGYSLCRDMEACTAHFLPAEIVERVLETRILTDTDVAAARLSGRMWTSGGVAWLLRRLRARHRGICPLDGDGGDYAAWVAETCAAALLDDAPRLLVALDTNIADVNEHIDLTRLSRVVNPTTWVTPEEDENLLEEHVCCDMFGGPPRGGHNLLSIAAASGASRCVGVLIALGARPVTTMANLVGFVCSNPCALASDHVRVWRLDTLYSPIKRPPKHVPNSAPIDGASPLYSKPTHFPQVVAILGHSHPRAPTDANPFTLLREAIEGIFGSHGHCSTHVDYDWLAWRPAMRLAGALFGAGFSIDERAYCAFSTRVYTDPEFYELDCHRRHQRHEWLTPEGMSIRRAETQALTEYDELVRAAGHLQALIDVYPHSLYYVNLHKYVRFVLDEAAWRNY